MKKILVFIIQLIAINCLCVFDIYAKTFGDSTSDTSLVTIFSVGAIIFGALSMAGGMYIMFYEPNKKKNKNKKKVNKKQDK